MNKRRYPLRSSSLPGALLGILAAPLSYSSTIYDLTADWSDSANPNGPWTYRHGNTALPSHANYLPGQFIGTQAAWAVAASGQGHIPSWLKSSAPPAFPFTDFQIGDVVVHAQDNANGVGLGQGNVIWTSPTTGTADIQGIIWLARNIGRSSHFSLYNNNTLLASGDVFTGDPYDRANPLAFGAANLAVAAGDVIRLEVERTSTFGEFTGVNLTIEVAAASAAVPEPSTLALIGAGIGLIAFTRRRNR